MPFQPLKVPISSPSVIKLVLPLTQDQVKEKIEQGDNYGGDYGGAETGNIETLNHKARQPEHQCVNY
jgi:hypothetical protein